MKWFYTHYTVIFLRLFIIVMLSQNVLAQNNQHTQPLSSFKVVDQTIYSKVLDHIFPKNELENYFAVFILRYEPSTEPESQIIILKDGIEIKVVRYTLSENMFGKLNKEQKFTKTEDLSKLTENIKIRKETLKFSSKVFTRWYKQFLVSFNSSLKSIDKSMEIFDKTGQEEVFLDGTFYRLSYKQGINMINLSFYDIEMKEQRTNTKQYNITFWMYNMYREIEKEIEKSKR